MEEIEASIEGIYEHYKGNRYIVYGTATDEKNNTKFVLYRADYEKRDVWVRPKDMFFGKVINKEGEEIERFKKTGRECDHFSYFYDFLESIRYKGVPVIRGTEDNQIYLIIKINSKDQSFIITENERYSGYLSDIFLAQRMGYTLLYIDNEKKLIKNFLELDARKTLIIGDNNEDIIKKNINPCSIDLTINKKDLLLTRRKKININSIVDLSDIEKYWKVYRKKRGNIVIKPGQGVYARIKEKITVPEDCAGKIEIKNTFARLGLDITSGDFCNPGWNGNFPLFIFNRGKISIELTGDEKIAQLMLLKTGPTIEIYNTEDHAFKSDEGRWDDGFPYNFFEGRALKQLRRLDGGQIIVEAENVLRKILTSGNEDEVLIDNIKFDTDEWLRQYVKYMDEKRRKTTKNKDEFSKTKLVKYTKKFLRKQAVRNKIVGTVLTGFSIIGVVFSALLEMFDIFEENEIIVLVIVVIGTIGVLIYLYLKNFKTHAEIRFKKPIEELFRVIK